MGKSDNEDIAWLAGILDGEGCFCVRRVNVNRYASNPNGNLFIFVTVQAASIRMIDQMQRVYEGIGIKFKRYGPIKRGGKEVFRIDVAKKVDVEKLLRAVARHLHVKDEEANTILRFFDKYPSHKNDFESTADERSNLVEIVKGLKRAA